MFLTSYVSPDSSHGKVTKLIHRGCGAKTMEPVKLGTYGKTNDLGNIAGLYMDFDIIPVIKDRDV